MLLAVYRDFNKAIVFGIQIENKMYEFQFEQAIFNYVNLNAAEIKSKYYSIPLDDIKCHINYLEYITEV